MTDNSFDQFIKNTFGSNDDHHKTVMEDFHKPASLGADIKMNENFFNSNSVHIPLKGQK